MTKKLLAGMLAIAATAFFAIAPLTASAQNVDAELRVQQLEEQLRQLNGRVEEMSFQLLQMQEQLRKARKTMSSASRSLRAAKRRPNSTSPLTRIRPATLPAIRRRK